MHLRLACLLALMLATFVIQRAPSSGGGETPDVICNHEKLKAADSSIELHLAWMEVEDQWDTLHQSCRMSVRVIMTEKTTVFQQRDDRFILLWRIPSFPKSACESPYSQIIPKSWRKHFHMPEGYV